MPVHNQKFVFGIFVILIFSNIIAWLIVRDLAGSHFLELNFFDIGQGDAIFIQTPNRHQILIDGGPSSEILKKLSSQMPFWDRTIDLIILTHPEYDHISGLLDVLERYKVANILWTGVLHKTKRFEQWQKLIKQEKAKIHIAQAGQKITFHKSSEVQPRKIEINILYPYESLEGQKKKNLNETSIVARLIFGTKSWLLTGDATKRIEKDLLKENYLLKSDVLKVGHHGSKTSSCEEFIEAVAPETAVICCGRDNRYGHPHQDVLETLEKYDIKILRTDQDGDIKIISDGKNYAISNF